MLRRSDHGLCEVLTSLCFLAGFRRGQALMSTFRALTLKRPYGSLPRVIQMQKVFWNKTNFMMKFLKIPLDFPIAKFLVSLCKSFVVVEFSMCLLCWCLSRSVCSQGAISSGTASWPLGWSCHLPVARAPLVE